MTAKTYSLTHAATELGVHRNTLKGWIADGCPAVKRGQSRGVEWELSLPAVFAWRCDFLVREAVAGYQTEDGRITKDEADRRRAIALAIVAEIEADTALRNVVSRSDAESVMADFCQALRSGLDNASAKIAGRAAIMTEPNEIREMCDREINRSFEAAREELDHLWGMASGAPPDDPEDDFPVD